MLCPSSGEINFSDGLRIAAHAPLDTIRVNGFFTEPLQAAGWHHHRLGEHESGLGTFEVNVVTGSGGRIEGAFLSHMHSFYEAATPNDSERRAFHEGVIATELRGQREFSWGQIFCRVDPKENRDWLVIIYSPFSQVPLRAEEIDRFLSTQEMPPGS